eukprot:SAG11_NODE_21801_length_418_cov_1.288401_2_plen_48_part_01
MHNVAYFDQLARLELTMSKLLVSATKLIQCKGCTGSAAQKCALILCCK